MKRIITILFILFFSFAMFAQETIISSSSTTNDDGNRIDWHSDLEYISKELPKKHYNLFSQKSETFFHSEIEKIKKESKSLTDIEVALEIQQLLASLGDSHTTLDYRHLLDKNQILPLQIYWFHDGLYVLATTRENSEILGCKIISINQVSIETIADSLSNLFTIDNQAVIKQKIPQLIPCIQILKYFNLANGDNVEVTYESKTDKNTTLKIKPTIVNRNNIAVYKADSIALCNKNEKVYFTDTYLKESNIYYLQYNHCWSKELELKFGKKEIAEKLPSFKDFEDNVFKTLETRSIDKIVFDLRFNGGKNSKQGTDFIRKLSMYLKKNPKVKLYVVLGRKTFSSAILNALDFKKMTNAIFVGEETAGKPNHFGELKELRLSNSQLNIYYSTKYFKYTDEDLVTLSPDILIDLSFTDFSKGIDPVFEWIKSQN